MEKRRQQREERRRRREEFKEKQRKEREERRRRREERRRTRAERRLEERARRNRRREDERERRRRGFQPASFPQGGYMIDVTDAGAEMLATSNAPFGHWNVLNRPVPFLGAQGGPRSLEGWAHLTTFALRALQRVTCAAFGGPGYLAGNLGVVHRNTVDNTPVGSRIGAHWSTLPDESVLQVCAREAVLDVVSVLEAGPGKQLCACGGAVLRVRREHRGDGDVEDCRPLLVLDDALGRGEADLISDDRGQFKVGHDRSVTAARLRVQVPCGQNVAAFEVARVCDGDAAPLVAIEADGRLLAQAGAAVAGRLVLAPGAVLEFAGGSAARIAVSEQGLALVVGEGDLQRRLLLGPKGLIVDGDVLVAGKVTQG